MFFLAPFCVIGGITVFRVLSGIVKVSWTNKSVKSSLKVLSVFLVIFLLFNSGFVYEVAKDHPGSISLSQESVKEYGDAGSKNSLYAGYFPEQDIFGIKYLSKNRNNNSKIYADRSHATLPFVSYGMMLHEYILTNTTKVQKDSYIYLGYINVHYSIMNGPDAYRKCWNITDLSPLLNEKNKIYINGGSVIYR
jgi:uncharacterized membrane protein